MEEHLDPYSILDLTTDLILVVDRHSLQVLFANDAFLKLTGYFQNQLTQLTLTEVYPDLARVDLAQLPSKQSPHPLNLIGADGFHCAVEARFDYRVIQDIPCLVCVADLATEMQFMARELHEQRTIYRALITGIFDLFFRIQRDGTYVDFKIPSELGLYEPETIDEIVGRNVAEVVPPDVTEIVMPVIERVIETGQPETVEYQIVEETGLHFYDACFAASLPDEIVAVVRDITEIRRNEAVLRHQRDLSATLSSGISLDEALTKVLETAIKVTGMDCGGIYLVDHVRDGALQLVEHCGLPEAFIEQASFYPPDAPQTQTILQGQSIYTDYPSLPVPSNDIGLQENLRAFAMIPIRHQQEVIGCINISSHLFGSEGIHETIRDALEAIAFYSGSAIVRMRTQEKLRESEEIARTLLNAPHDTALLIDRELKTLAINEAGARRFQSTVEALIGQNMLDHMPSLVSEGRRVSAEWVFRTGEPCTIEDERAGTHFSTTLYPLFDTKGNVSRLAVFSRDVTIEKLTEQRRQKKDALLEAVAQASNRLLAADDITVAMYEALELIGKAAQAHRAYIFKNHAHTVSGKLATSQILFWTESDMYEKDRLYTIQNQEWRVPGLADWYDTLIVGGTINGVLSEFSEPIQNLLGAFGIKSLLLVPIFIERDEFWGLIGFDDRCVAREWLSEEVSVLRLMAASMGAAIKRQQVEETIRREREIADTLREVGMVLHSTLDLEEVFERILEQAKRVIPYDAANIMLLENGVGRFEVGKGYENVGMDPEEVKKVTFRVEQTPILRAMLETFEPYVCPDVDKDDRWVYQSNSLWVKSWLGAPIVLRGKMIGWFSFDSHVADFYNEQHLRLIQPFAKQAAIAFENASLFAEMQSLERIKSEMIHIASHDLRNPLTRIQKAIATIKQNADPSLTAQQLKDCEQIADASVDMEQIITNILSVERIEAQHRAAQLLDWCDLIEQSLKLVQADLTAKQHDLTVECADDLPDTRGDPVQLQRSIVNLLGNAIKFTPPGGSITLRVYSKPYGFDQTVAVEVEDNGIGIPQEQQIDLYKPYYRAQHSRDIDGTGLGLSIVKKVIEHHQGNVYFKSTPGKGSMFGFWIPAHS